MATFHVIKIHTSEDSFPNLLGQPWFRMADVVVDWGEIKPSITYNHEGTRVKVSIGSSTIEEVEKGSISNSEEDECYKEMEDRKLVKNAQAKKGKATVGTNKLGGLGPSLYH